MNSTVGLIIFVLIWVVGLTWLFVGIIQQRQVFTRLAELATQKGWQFEKSPSNFVDCLLSGQAADIHWEMTYINREQTFGRQRTQSIVWFSGDARSQAGSLVILPKPPGLPAQMNMGAMGQMLVDGLLQQLGVNASGLMTQTVGSTLFQQKYTVLAVDAAPAERLAARVEALLLDWPQTASPFNKPSLMVDAAGIKVHVNRTSTSAKYQIQVAESLVPLGIAAVDVFR